MSGLSKKSAAQKIHISDPEVDSSFIQYNKKEWSLRAFGVTKFHNIILKNSDKTTIKYRPNNPFSFGLGFTYRFLIIDLGIVLNKKAQFENFDFQSNLLLKQNLIEFVFQKYQGFYQLIDKSDKLFRDDLKSTFFTINHFYNVNDKKLSLGTALAGNKIQMKSTGTVILGSYLSYNKIAADSSLVDFSNQPQFDRETRFKTLEMYNVGAYFGYAYSLVLPKNFIVFSNLTPGIGFNFAEATGDETYKPPIFPAGKLNFRIAIGNYSKRIYTILGFNTNLSLINLGNGNSLRHNAGQIKLVIGYRMKKSNKIIETIDKTF